MTQSIAFVHANGFGTSVRTARTPALVSTLDRKASWEMLDTTMEPLFAIDPEARGSGGRRLVLFRGKADRPALAGQFPGKGHAMAMAMATG